MRTQIKIKVGFLAATVILTFLMSVPICEAWNDSIQTIVKFRSTSFDKLGVAKDLKYSGDGLAVIPTAAGATLRCAFQKLDGEATSEGLWLTSTTSSTLSDRSQVKAIALGREVTNQLFNEQPSRSDIQLTTTGEVTVSGHVVFFHRPYLVEEYRTGVDGIEQDFVVIQRPSGTGKLHVWLNVQGAVAEPTQHGARLVVEQSDRRILYSQLRVVDSNGHGLPARLDVRTAKKLLVVVNDTGAVYPLRIDPTFSDANWSPLGAGMNAQVESLTVSGSHLYAGGAFTTAGNIFATNIAEWDGSRWSALGSGIDGWVTALASSGNTVYAGGWFSIAGGNLAFGFAKWDGNTWSGLGSGTLGSTSFVYALAVSGTNLYAGGRFTMVGGLAITNIAKWDGSSWSALGPGLNGEVDAIIVSGTNLYAGGRFSKAGSLLVNHVAKWDGENWSALGPGIPGTVYYVTSLAMSDTNLYAGGWFTAAGYATATNVAKWDGNVWSALGSGVNSVVDALTISDGDLYAGGWFTAADDTPANYIAKWDGSTWSPLGSGMDEPVFVLAASGSRLYAGGMFAMAGGKVCAGVAEADLNLSLPLVIVTTNGLFGFADNQFRFSLSGPDGSNAVIQASTNLQAWTPLETNSLTGGTLIFTDTDPTNYPYRFYRAVLLP